MMIFEGDTLFTGQFIRDWYQRQLDQVEEIVYSLDINQFTASTDAQITDYVLSKLAIQPIELHKDKITMTQPTEAGALMNDFGRTVRVPALRFTVSIPFTGNTELWTIGHSPYQSIYPKGGIARTSQDGVGLLQLQVLQKSEDSLEGIRGEIDKALQQIEECLRRQAEQLGVMIEEVKPDIRDAIERRRGQQASAQQLMKILEIPLSTRPGSPDFEPIPMREKITKPLPVVEQGQKPEPGISEENYERILSLIRHMGRTMEGAPMTFSQLGEESLRDVFLASLNAIYEGDATGETFRGRGKADIHIEDEQRAAFIAECKIWNGEAEFLKAIDQLFRYLLWRDCKTSIVIFNKHNVRFSELLDKVSAIVAQHDRFVSEVINNAENGEWRYVFLSEDPSRKIKIHIFVFNLFVGADSD